MIRIILILIIISGLIGIIYFKVLGFKSPDTSLEERVKALETAVVSIRAELKSIPDPSPDSSTVQNTNYEDRISALEKGVSAPKSQLSVSRPPLYIPLGSGGMAGDKSWYSVPGYEVLIDTADYSGYLGMQLEANFRLVEKSGIGYARLYNQTDSLPVSGELSSSLDSLSLQATQSFKLPSGKKTYRLQVKNTEGVNLEIQSARIKVSF